MYENAKNGIGKVFTSQILAILAVLCALVAGLFAAVTLTAVDENLTGATFGGSVGLALFTLASAVLLVIAFILEMVGLNVAGRDEPLFKKAFIVSVVGLIISIVLGALASLTTISWIIDLKDICNFFIGLIIVHHVLYGVANICPSLSDKAMSVWKVYMATIIIAVVVNIVSIVMALLKLYTGSAVLLIVFTLLDAVLQIVAYVMFVSFLAKAKKEII